MKSNPSIKESHLVAVGAVVYSKAGLGSETYGPPQRSPEPVDYLTSGAMNAAVLCELGPYPRTQTVNDMSPGAEFPSEGNVRYPR